MMGIANYHVSNLDIFILIVNSFIDISYGRGYRLEKMLIYLITGCTSTFLSYCLCSSFKVKIGWTDMIITE